MSNPIENLRPQFSWMRNASAVAMARGVRRPHLLSGSIVEDLSLNRGPGRRRLRALRTAR